MNVNVVCVDAAAKAEIDKLKKDAVARGKYRYVLYCFINIHVAVI